MKAKKLENQVFQFNYERPSNPFVVSNFTKEPLGDITMFPLEYSSKATRVIVLFLTGSLDASESALTNTITASPLDIFPVIPSSLPLYPE